ncbi:HEAT repeat domain-containing protein [Streptomyces sp. NPDC013978]|uniref:HEAT repeat domain-containing protein n=1 Tax=Streptomyces sp. NPDC013978 TaxID=3364869 RepID=UPI0036FE16B6
MEGALPLPSHPAPHAASSSTSSARLLELVALAEEQPELAALRPYLTDPAPTVRREAVAVLTETLPPGTGSALAEALRDSAPEVRAAAAASLRELVETLPPDAALRDGLAAALTEPDPVVRAAALDVLRALVSVDAATELAHAAPIDPSREVRVTLAKALATVSADRTASSPPAAVLTALTTLTTDPDALVRAAAYGALGTVGCPPPLASQAVTALADPAWQVRAGAATALSTATTAVAVPALAEALSDPNADVRKAAVLSLTHHTPDESARTALTTATKDPDADVRAYASRAL